MEVSLSFWEKEVFYEKVDLIIVGAGIVGLTAALAYKKRNPSAKIQILDEAILPRGASTRNAGFACFGSMTELMDDIASNGEDACIALVQKRWEGLQKLRSIVGDQAMDYQNLGGNELFLEQEHDTYQKALNEMHRLNKMLHTALGHQQIFSLNPESNGIKSLAGMIHNRLEGQLHPGKMINCLLEQTQEAGIKIVRGGVVENIEGDQSEVVCRLKNNQSLKSNFLLLATNGFSNKLMKGLDLKPARNQVLLTKPIANLSIRGCYHYHQGYIYFRNVGDRLLLGGGRHWDKIGATTSEYGDHKGIQTKLLKFMKDYLIPNKTIEVEHKWSGILGIGNQKKPIVEFQSPTIAVAIRLGGMGVAIGASVGEEAAELLSNR